MKNRLRGLLCLLCLWSPLLPASREIPGGKQGLELLRQLSVAQPMLAEAFDRELGTVLDFVTLRIAAAFV